MRHHPTAVFAAVLLTASLAGPSLAQSRPTGEPQAEFRELIEVTEVFLDVLATDKKGHLIEGLGKDDFVVVEDGEEVPITSVDFYTTRYAGGSAPAAGETAAPAAAEVPSSRYFILVFEDQVEANASFPGLLRQQLDAGRRAHEWVRDELQPSDWVAVLSYDVKLKVHQDFTQDVPALIDALAAAVQGKEPELVTHREYRREISRAPLSLLKGLPEGIALRDETPTIYDALRLVGDATRPVVGRKNLVLFTIGFGDVRGNFTEPDQRYYPQMEQALNDNNVAVYPVDLTPPGTRHLQASFLNQLAVDTGGEYHYNFVNFLTPLRQIADENVGYYLLSYRTEHPAGEKGYREVKVKAKDKKIVVRSRRGYEYGS